MLAQEFPCAQVIIGMLPPPARRLVIPLIRFSQQAPVVNGFIAYVPQIAETRVMDRTRGRALSYERDARFPFIAPDPTVLALT